ncbi:DUF5983 family protein [Acetobacter conturbans]|uniref:DUF5983 domain-containing protein n=1 Tax=Acetobacter conturbans TaxID=1737472 RepID=A0ABX0K2Z4_9PROT|nr:hypothetical protein [Acetobacter conturbans]NHN90122.1 hypothetical protein [Acetobacter conturbans]
MSDTATVVSLPVARQPRNVRRVLDLSTAHLDRGDTLEFEEYLVTKGQNGSMPCLSGPYGWLVSVPDELESIHDDASPGLYAILAYAKEAGCDWVLFDRDGDIDDRFPVQWQD